MHLATSPAASSSPQVPPRLGGSPRGAQPCGYWVRPRRLPRRRSQDGGRRSVILAWFCREPRASTPPGVRPPPPRLTRSCSQQKQTKHCNKTSAFRRLRKEKRRQKAKKCTAESAAHTHHSPVILRSTILQANAACESQVVLSLSLQSRRIETRAQKDTIRRQVRCYSRHRRCHDMKSNLCDSIWRRLSSLASSSSFSLADSAAFFSFSNRRRTRA